MRSLSYIVNTVLSVQSGDVLLLQQLGLSEEEQLKLALELSVQGIKILCCLSEAIKFCTQSNAQWRNLLW